MNKANMCMIGQRHGKAETQTNYRKHTETIRNARPKHDVSIQSDGFSANQIPNLISSLSLKYPAMSSKDADVCWQLFL